MRSILGLTLVLILFIGMLGTGSWAYFSDPEISGDNPLQAGTLDLKTDDADGVSQTLLAMNMRPGDIVGPATIILKNNGSIDGTTLDLAFAYIESDSSPNPAPMTANATAAIVEVLTLNYDDSSILGSVSDNNSNGYTDVEDLAKADLSGQSGIATSDSDGKDFEISVRLRSDANKDFQADGINLTMTFILKQ